MRSSPTDQGGTAAATAASTRAFRSGAERLPAHRPRQVDLPELRPGARVRRPLQPADGRHEPRDGGETEFVHAIEEDVRWLGFDWEDRSYYASDYFERLYDCAVTLIRKGQGVRRRPVGRGGQRAIADAGTSRAATALPRPPGGGEPGSVRPGCGPASSKTARARCGQDRHGGANMNLRDPTIYRDPPAAPTTGRATTGVIYPTYDFTHPPVGRLRAITHSLCTLEFEDHRPLYDWYLQALDWEDLPPRQIEFARLNLTLHRAEQAEAAGTGPRRASTSPAGTTRGCRRWSGMRRRGYTPQAAIRDVLRPDWRGQVRQRRCRRRQLLDAGSAAKISTGPVAAGYGGHSTR